MALNYQDRGSPYERLESMHIKHLHNLVDRLLRQVEGRSEPRQHYIFENRNSRAVANFIKGNFSADQINRYHDELTAEYKDRPNTQKVYKRGRPMNAKNKDKAVDALDSIYDLEPVDDGKPIYSSDDFSGPDGDNRLLAALNAPDTPATLLDSNKFALKTELRDVATALEKALRGYCESNFNSAFDAINTHEQVILKHTKDIYALEDAIKNIADHRPTIIELKRQDMPSIQLGVQHKNFPLLVAAANARMRSNNHLNVWLFGPAGTGKTTAAERLAELMGLDFWYNGALTSAFQLLGYNDANGKYVTTAFRKAWENGGVYLFDEIDGSMPDALLAMNGALANSVASFPDGMIKRHPDCIILAGANTTGLGGGIEYVGAMKQNAAFLNRFVYVPWPHDNALEDALCANKEWLARVRYVRARFATQGNKGHLITMRATIFGEALLAAGIEQSEVENATLKQGLSDAQWNAIK